MNKPQEDKRVDAWDALRRHADFWAACRQQQGDPLDTYEQRSPQSSETVRASSTLSRPQMLSSQLHPR
jgi:hypothetical protein